MQLTNCSTHLRCYIGRLHSVAHRKHDAVDLSPATKETDTTAAPTVHTIRELLHIGAQLRHTRVQWHTRILSAANYDRCVYGVKQQVMIPTGIAPGGLPQSVAAIETWLDDRQNIKRKKPQKSGSCSIAISLLQAVLSRLYKSTRLCNKSPPTSMNYASSMSFTIDNSIHFTRGVHIQGGLGRNDIFPPWSRRFALNPQCECSPWRL